MTTTRYHADHSWFSELTVSGRLSSTWCHADKENLLERAIEQLNAVKFIETELDPDSAKRLFSGFEPSAMPDNDSFFYINERRVYTVESVMWRDSITATLYSLLVVMKYGSMSEQPYVQSMINLYALFLKALPRKRLSDNQASAINALIQCAIRFDCKVPSEWLRHYYRMAPSNELRAYFKSRHAAQHTTEWLKLNLEESHLALLFSNKHPRSTANNQKALQHAIKSFNWDNNPYLLENVLRTMVVGYCLNKATLSSLKAKWPTRLTPVETLCQTFNGLSVKARETVNDMVEDENILDMFAVKLFGTPEQVQNMQYYMLQQAMSINSEHKQVLLSIDYTQHNSHILALALTDTTRIGDSKVTESFAATFHQRCMNMISKWERFLCTNPYGALEFASDAHQNTQYHNYFLPLGELTALNESVQGNLDESIVSWVKNRVHRVCQFFELHSLETNVQQIKSMYALLPYLPVSLKSRVQLLNYGGMDQMRWLMPNATPLQFRNASNEIIVTGSSWIESLPCSDVISQHFHEALRFLGVLPATSPDTAMVFAPGVKMQSFLSYSAETSPATSLKIMIKHVPQVLPALITAYSHIKAVGGQLTYEQLPALSAVDVEWIIETVEELDTLYASSVEDAKPWCQVITKSQFVRMGMGQWFSPQHLVEVLDQIAVEKLSRTMTIRQLVNQFLAKNMVDPPFWVKPLIDKWDKDARSATPDRYDYSSDYEKYFELEKLIISVDSAKNTLIANKPRNLPQLAFDFAQDGQTYYVRMLDRGDPYGYYMGEFSGCCQHVDGYAAELVEVSVDHDDVGVMVIETGSKRLIAQSCVWVTKDTAGQKYIAIDSIETLFNDKDPVAPAIVQAYVLAIRHWTNAGFTTLHSGSKWIDNLLASDLKVKAANIDTNAIHFDIMEDMGQGVDFSISNALALTA